MRLLFSVFKGKFQFHLRFTWDTLKIIEKNKKVVPEEIENAK